MTGEAIGETSASESATESAVEALAQATAAAAEPVEPAAEAVVEAEPETTTEPEAEVESDLQAAPEAEVEAEAKPSESPAPTDAEAEAEEQVAADAAAEEQVAADAAAEQQVAADAAAEVEATAETEAVPESGTEPEAESGAQAAPDTEPEAESRAQAAPDAAGDDAEPPESAAQPAAKKTTPAKAAAKNAAPPERPELRPIYEAMDKRQSLEGRVIGWNNGGFHLALGEQAAFCPRSEMEVGDIQEPESYLDQTFLFRVLRLQGKGRRIVVSRAAHLRNEKSRQRNQLRKQLKPGTELEGTVASLTDFGAFVDLGGTQGLVHVSEISHSRVEHPSEVLQEGQQVKVKVLKIEQGGRRISLSMRALEPDPWQDLADRFPAGAVVQGKVEKANDIGAFIELAPGLTGLLPARQMSIPRETNPARAYPPGKVVSVQIVSVDPRRRRIALALEGSGLEGSRTDYQEYQRHSRKGSSDGEGFNALASAFRRLKGDDE